MIFKYSKRFRYAPSFNYCFFNLFSFTYILNTISTLCEDSAILRQSLPMQYNINQELDGAVTYHMVYVFHKKRLITLECTSMTINDIEGPFWAVRLSG